MNAKKFFLVFLFYLLLSILLYSPVLGSFFVSDDFDWLARAKNIPLTFENYFLNNTDAVAGGGVYRPLTSLSFWLNYQVSGLSPASYHLVNIIFHALNAFLVFWVVFLLSWRTLDSNRGRSNPLCHPERSEGSLNQVKKEKGFFGFRPQNDSCWMVFLRNDYLLAFLAGLFFTILPNHPEAVSWISGRNDVLATFFYLLSLISYIYFRQKGKFYFLLLSLFCFLLSLLSKETAVTLPLILIIYEVVWHFGQKDRSWRTVGQKVLLLAPFIFLLFCYFAVRYHATGLFYGSYSSASLNFTWSRAVDTFLGGLVSHFLTGHDRLLAVQWLSHYGHWVIGAMAIVSFILIKVRLYLFSILFFIFSLGPVYYLKFNHLTGEGERFFYLPSVGVAILLALLVNICAKGASRFAGKYLKTMRLVIFFGLIILLGGYFSHLLYQKNLVWQKAGQLSQSLLVDFAHETNLQAGEGTVIIGLPDNIDGAPVFRNGWLAALSLFYPSYQPDVLVAKVGLNLTAANFNQKIIDWQKLADGYAGLPLVSDYLFYGARNLKSADYQMTINDYETNILSGQQVEIYFTPNFLRQWPAKKINFLVFDSGHLIAIEPLKIEAGDKF